MTQNIITEEEKRWIRDALSYWQPRLAPEWTIGFNPDERPQTSKDARGELGRSSDYLLASLRVKPPGLWCLDSEDWSLPLEVETLVVHELGHCVMHDLQHTHRMIHPHFSREAWAVQESHFDHHLERTIERWSRVLVAQRYGFDPVKGPEGDLVAANN